MERLPLGTPYPGIVAYISRLLGRLPGAELVIDLTGVGRPVFDMFRFSGITPTGVLITSGAAETGGGPIQPQTAARREISQQCGRSGDGVRACPRCIARAAALGRWFFRGPGL